MPKSYLVNSKKIEEKYFLAGEKRSIDVDQHDQFAQQRLLQRARL